ncbi:hypothetical protein C7B18_26695 [Escherichia coli]|nr:hypothetical protein C7B18_26695 [Escherichia coli]CAD5882620.1 Uncharacterised protein [Escherichia coli]
MYIGSGLSSELIVLGCFFIKFKLNKVDVVSSGVFSPNGDYIIMDKIEVDFIERIYTLWRKNGVNAVSDTDVIIC